MEDRTIQNFILQRIDAAGEVDSLTILAEIQQVSQQIKDHQALYQYLLSLQALGIIALEGLSDKRLEITPEGELYRERGSPEFIFGQVVAEHPELDRAQVTELYQQRLLEIFGENPLIDRKTLATAALGKAKQMGYIKMDKSGIHPGTIEADQTRDLLNNISELPPKIANDLKKRNMLQLVTVKWFKITKGEKFVNDMSLYKKPVVELTEEMMRSGEWQNVEFAPLNFEALGQRIPCGHQHPLMRVRQEFRQIFMQMGFEEMDTSNYLESSFWNFDSLFQGQQHPCRDLHDTFFIKDPELSNPIADQEYFEHVKKTHQTGGFGSIGLRYKFDEKIPLTNILRTHTTAVSSRYLKKIADEFKATGQIRPRKFFSIDRVYRNETADATHLSEFFQIEGFCLGQGYSLVDLMNHIQSFFSRIGMAEVEFRPTYNPYTEPSMEIYAFNPQKGQWLEVGNSGMFRPEMIYPMGIPEDWNVIAWGLSLERPTMIEYELKEIRKLEGPEVLLDMIDNLPICRITF